MKLEAQPGESVYSFLERSLDFCKYETKQIGIIAEHNDIEINVYVDSALTDLLEKYDLKRKLNRLEG